MVHFSMVGHIICESLCLKRCIEIKYIDIAQNLTAQWVKMGNALDFSKSDQIALRSCIFLAIFQ